MKLLQTHCERLLDPLSDNFAILPAAACFAGPAIVRCLLTTNRESLYHSAKSFIIQHCKQVKHAQSIWYYFAALLIKITKLSINN